MGPVSGNFLRALRQCWRVAVGPALVGAEELAGEGAAGRAMRRFQTALGCRPIGASLISDRSCRRLERAPWGGFRRTMIHVPGIGGRVARRSVLPNRRAGCEHQG